MNQSRTRPVLSFPERNPASVLHPCSTEPWSEAAPPHCSASSQAGGTHRPGSESKLRLSSKGSRRQPSSSCRPGRASRVCSKPAPLSDFKGMPRLCPSPQAWGDQAQRGAPQFSFSLLAGHRPSRGGGGPPSLGRARAENTYQRPFQQHSKNPGEQEGATRAHSTVAREATSQGAG